MMISRRLEKCLLGDKVRRLDRSMLFEFKNYPHGGGIVPFVSSLPTKSPSIRGNLLLDPTLSSPIQVINWNNRPFSHYCLLDALVCAAQKRLDFIYSLPKATCPSNHDPRALSHLSDLPSSRPYPNSSPSQIQNQFGQTKKKDKMAILKDLNKLNPSHRSPPYPNRSNGAYRLVNELVDNLPGLSIDIYANYAVIHLFSASWKPYLSRLSQWLLSPNTLSSTNIDAPSPHTNMIYDEINQIKDDQELSCATEAPFMPLRGVYLVDRTRSISSPSVKAAPRPHCLLGRSAENDQVIVEESGCKFLIRLDHVSSGLYLNQRATRAKLLELLLNMDEPRTLLNAFSFTSAFSVLAAKYANTKTTNIDANASVLEWARENFRINEIDLEHHYFRAQDAFQVIEGMLKNLLSSNNELENPTRTYQDGSYSMILLDPPKLARGRHPESGSTTILAMTEHYGRLIELAAPLVKPNGYLVLLFTGPQHQVQRWEDKVEKALQKVGQAGIQQTVQNAIARIRRKMRKLGIKQKYRHFLIDKVEAKIRKSVLTDKEHLRLNQDSSSFLYQFSLIQRLEPDRYDFPWLEGDTHEPNLHGMICKHRSVDLTNHKIKALEDQIQWHDLPLKAYHSSRHKAVEKMIKNPKSPLDGKSGRTVTTTK